MRTTHKIAAASLLLFRNRGASSPVNTVAVSHDYEGIAPNVGDEATLTPGTWSGSPVLTYQWRRNGVDIGGETGLTYTFVDADFGLTVDVIEIPDGVTASAVASAATGAVRYSSLVRWFERPTANIAVAYWQDIAASAEHAVQATADNRALRRTGDAQLGESLDFVSADSLKWTTALTLNDFTVFAVISMDALGSFMTIIGSSASNNNTMGVSTSTGVSLNGSGAAYAVSLGVTLTTATKYVICFRREGLAANNISVYVNNTLAGQTSGNNAVAALDQIGIRGTNLSGWDGRMKAVMIFNAALGSTARTAVHDYLAALP
jgi:hypothetical protein